MFEKFHLHDPKYWRDRERETRALADCMFYEDTKRQLNKAADSYARRAEFAERRCQAAAKRTLRTAKPG